MEDKQRKLAFDLDNGKTVILYFKDLDELDLDDIVKIDYANLMGEYLTVPTIFNAVANLRSEVKNEFAKKSFLFDIWWSKKFKEEKSRIKMTDKQASANISETMEYKNKKMNLINLEMYVETLDNAYWSLKDKSKKLDKIYEKMNVEEFTESIIEGQVNKIYIKLINSSIHGK